MGVGRSSPSRLSVSSSPAAALRTTTLAGLCPGRRRPRRHQCRRRHPPQPAAAHGQGKVIALTFDGGSDAAGAASILDTLNRRGVPATFFLTGGFARRFPDVTSRIAAEHLVGNHTETHPDLTKLADRKVEEEVRRAESTLRRATGQDPRRFFRFPFGARTAHAVATLNRLCYVAFRWTVDTLGWQGTSSGESVGSVTSRVLSGAVPGGIVLMHVGAHPDDKSTLDAAALPAVIDGLRARGYRFVALSAVMGTTP